MTSPYQRLISAIESAEQETGKLEYLEQDELREIYNRLDDLSGWVVGEIFSRERYKEVPQCQS